MEWEERALKYIFGTNMNNEAWYQSRNSTKEMLDFFDDQYNGNFEYI